MAEISKIAQYYLQSYEDYFWKWDTDHSIGNGDFNCISTYNDITIAYNPQIIEVLDILRFQKLPAYGALLLSFIATNSYSNSKSVITSIFDFVEDIINQHNFKQKSVIHFEGAKQFLITLSEVNSVYKKDRNRIQLLAVIFKSIHDGISPKYAHDILRVLRNKSVELETCTIPNPLKWNTILRDFRTLGLLNKVFPTVKSIYDAIKNIPEISILEDDESLDTTTIKKSGDFIDELKENPQTFFVGSLIKQLWSGLELPLKQVHPGEMPIGGVSDISNKGEFQNLLITEFANDDQTFLNRLANNEALYIRREVTPEEDLRTRLFLIDTTIKNWGTPKTLHFAAAIALLKHPKNTMDFLPFVVDSGYKEISLNTVDDIIHSIKNTSASFDATDGIITLLEDYNDEDIEITLFTSVKTLEHLNMKALFHQNHQKFSFIITSDTLGNVSMYQIKQGSKHLRKHIKLPLEKLWSNPPKAKKQKHQQHLEISEVRNYPILYASVNSQKAIFYANGHQFVLHKKTKLFKKMASGKGYEMVEAPIQFSSGIKSVSAVTLIDNVPTLLYWGTKGTLTLRNFRNTYKFEGDIVRDFSNGFRPSLLPLNDKLYLSSYYYSGRYGHKYFELSLEEETITKVEYVTDELKNYFKPYRKVLHSYETGSIFTKIKTICINANGNLVFNSKHFIAVAKTITYSTGLYNHQIKVSAYKFNRFEARFSDGSKIIIDPFGILTFISSNTDIPKFYMPSTLNMELCFATEKEFAGNTYFLRDANALNVISIDTFAKKYYKPFVNTILNS